MTSFPTANALVVVTVHEEKLRTIQELQNKVLDLMSPDELINVSKSAERLSSQVKKILREKHKICTCYGLDHELDCPEHTLPL